MAALLWGAWGTEWELNEKVSFNGTTKQITVNAGVTSIDISADVYSAWVRWTARERGYLPAMRYSGFDAIPGGRTGATFFLQNGWKLVYNPNLVAVNGVLYSEDYGTAYWSVDYQPIYPATVSSLVNSAISYQNVITGTASTPEEIATQVRAEIAIELARLDSNVSAVPTNVWTHSITALTDKTTIGGYITKLLLTIPKFIGLK
jgi:hypothetical protein